MRNFAHLLYNNGFYDADSLKATVQAWRELYETVRPDLIVFDHSPTALLAACGFQAKKALQTSSVVYIGHGSAGDGSTEASIEHSGFIRSLLANRRKNLNCDHLCDDLRDLLAVALRQPLPQMIQRNLRRTLF